MNNGKIFFKIFAVLLLVIPGYFITGTSTDSDTNTAIVDWNQGGEIAEKSSFLIGSKLARLLKQILTQKSSLLFPMESGLSWGKKPG
jgi:hypothetical protein